MAGDSPRAFSRGSDEPVVEGAATEQAKGILSVAFTVSPDEAHLLLEVRARETDLGGRAAGRARGGALDPALGW